MSKSLLDDGAQLSRIGARWGRSGRVSRRTATRALRTRCLPPLAMALMGRVVPFQALASSGARLASTSASPVKIGTRCRLVAVFLGVHPID
jgi:hypothetical protein